MRRFIKTFTVRRHVQYTVVQDSAVHAFLVQRWAADDDRTDEVCRFEYPDGGDLAVTRDDAVAARERARGDAIAEASRLCAADRAGLEASGAAEARLD